MGKKISEIIFIIVFFPFTIIFFILKLLNKIIQKKQINKYLSSITLDNIDSLSGDEFEDFLYYLLLSMDFKVKKTKKSHDYGADLIINSKNKKIVIQCKLYNNHTVGNSAVQEVYTATNYYNASLGVIITNSYFSKPAINLAEKSGIILWNRNTLNKILNLKSNEKQALKESLLG
ncbi:MAG: restriction endonuclease [Christensenellales bacterium]